MLYVRKGLKDIGLLDCKNSSISTITIEISVVSGNILGNKLNLFPEMFPCRNFLRIHIKFENTGNEKKKKAKIY